MCNIIQQYGTSKLLSLSLSLSSLEWRKKQHNTELMTVQIDE